MAGNKFTPDINTEQAILSQVLRFKKPLELFENYLTIKDFYFDEHKNLASCIFSILDKKYQLKDDIILAESKQIKIGKEFDFQFLKDLKEKYEQGEIDILPLIEKLKRDSVFSILIENDIPNLYENLFKKTTSLNQIEHTFDVLKEKLNTAKIIVSTDFLSLKDLTKLHDSIDKKRKDGDSFWTTGFMNLDYHLTYGFLPKGITVVAGRPGMAKTAFVINMAKNLSNKKKYCALFSLESDSLSFYDRLLSQYTRIPIWKFVKDRRNLSNEEIKTLEFEKTRLRKNNYLFVNDKPSSLKYIKEQVSILQNQVGKKDIVVIIDLFMKVRDMLDSGSEFSAGLYERNLNIVQTQIAKELECHVVLVAQIIRTVENRRNRRPRLSDLKSSGAWEEIADLVLGLHREAYYLEKYDNEEVDEDILEIQILKQRQGQDGQVVKFLFEKETTSVFNYTDPEEIDNYEKFRFLT